MTQGLPTPFPTPRGDSIIAISAGVARVAAAQYRHDSTYRAKGICLALDSDWQGVMVLIDRHDLGDPRAYTLDVGQIPGWSES